MITKKEDILKQRIEELESALEKTILKDERNADRLFEIINIAKINRNENVYFHAMMMYDENKSSIADSKQLLNVTKGCTHIIIKAMRK